MLVWVFIRIMPFKGVTRVFHMAVSDSSRQQSLTDVIPPCPELFNCDLDCHMRLKKVGRVENLATIVFEITTPNTHKNDLVAQF